MKWQGELEEREAQVLAAEEVICESLRELEEGRSAAEEGVARREAAVEVSLVSTRLLLLLRWFAGLPQMRASSWLDMGKLAQARELKLRQQVAILEQQVVGILDVCCMPRAAGLGFC